jgi:anaerobic ribonucleoside-triphosphate reductase
LTWKLVTFFHNCVMSYAQWYIWNEMKFSNWNSYMPDIKIFENRECSMTICNGNTFWHCRIKHNIIDSKHVRKVTKVSLFLTYLNDLNSYK